jgi:hypothetical protein
VHALAFDCACLQNGSQAGPGTSRASISLYNLLEVKIIEQKIPHSVSIAYFATI